MLLKNARLSLAFLRRKYGGFRCWLLNRFVGLPKRSEIMQLLKPCVNTFLILFSTFNASLFFCSYQNKNPALKAGSGFA